MEPTDHPSPNKRRPKHTAANPKGQQPDEHSVNWYKDEVRRLQAEIKGYQTLDKLLHESKREARLLRHENERLRVMCEGMVNPAIKDVQSSLVTGLGEPESLSSLTEEKRRIADEEQGRTTPPASSSRAPRTAVEQASEEQATGGGGIGGGGGHTSVASENSELGDMEMITHTDVESARNAERMASMGRGHDVTHSVTASLEIDPFDLQMSPENPGYKIGGTEHSFSLEGLPNAARLVQSERSRAGSNSTGNTSGSIVVIPSEETDPPPPPGHGRLAAQVRNISDALMKDVGLNAPSALADALARLSIDVLKVEKELRLKQSMINCLCPENDQLRGCMATVREKEQTIRQLEEENKQLKDKLLRQVGPSAAQSSAPQDWVHVQRSAKDVETSTQEEKRWERRMRDMEAGYEKQVRQLKARLEVTIQQLKEAETGGHKRQEEADRLYQLTKEATQKDRLAKEEAQRQYYVEQERRHQCETELIAARRRAEMLADRNSTLETQLLVYERAGQPPESPADQEAFASLALLSSTELRTQVQILRQQVAVYKEDFDRERMDRERVQAEKDTLQNALTQFKRDLTIAQRKVRELEQQKELMRSENECLRVEVRQIRQSEHDIVRLQSENRGLREQLQQQLEEICRHTGAIPSPAMPMAGGAVRENETRTWRCAVCTFANPAVRTACEMCGRMGPRQAQRRRAEDRLLAHMGPVHGWTECDSNKTPRPPATNPVTTEDDLVVDQGEDQTDSTRR